MAEIQGGGPLAHQQLSMHHHHHNHHHHHHRGVQPSLVMNQHMDIDCHQTGLEIIHPANISKFDKLFCGREIKFSFMPLFQGIKQTACTQHKIYQITKLLLM